MHDNTLLVDNMRDGQRFVDVAVAQVLFDTSCDVGCSKEEATSQVFVCFECNKLVSFQSF